MDKLLFYLDHFILVWKTSTWKGLMSSPESAYFYIELWLCGEPEYSFTHQSSLFCKVSDAQSQCFLHINLKINVALPVFLMHIQRLFFGYASWLNMIITQSFSYQSTDEVELLQNSEGETGRSSSSTILQVGYVLYERPGEFDLLVIKGKKCTWISSEYSLNIIKWNVLLVGAIVCVFICLEYFVSMVTSSHGCGFILFSCSLVCWERNKVWGPDFFFVDRYNIVSVVMNCCLFLFVPCFYIREQMRWSCLKTGRVRQGEAAQSFRYVLCKESGDLF